MKGLIVGLVALPSAYLAATQSQEILDVIVPEATATVSSVNLRTIYQQAVYESYLQDRSVEQVLPEILDGLETEGFRYSLYGSTIRVESDDSCILGVIGVDWFNVVEC